MAITYYATPLTVACDSVLSVPGDSAAVCEDMAGDLVTLGDGVSEVTLPENLVVETGSALVLNIPDLASLAPGELTVLPGGSIKLSSGLAVEVQEGTLYKLLSV
jgi:hypothetical protein